MSEKEICKVLNEIIGKYAVDVIEKDCLTYAILKIKGKK